MYLYNNPSINPKDTLRRSVRLKDLSHNSRLEVILGHAGSTPESHLATAVASDFCAGHETKTQQHSLFAKLNGEVAWPTIAKEEATGVIEESTSLAVGIIAVSIAWSCVVQDVSVVVAARGLFRQAFRDTKCFLASLPR